MDETTPERDESVGDTPSTAEGVEAAAAERVDAGPTTTPEPVDAATSRSGRVETAPAAAERVEAAPRTVCERCGGGHTRRQRCPLDPLPVGEHRTFGIMARAPATWAAEPHHFDREYRALVAHSRAIAAADGGTPAHLAVLAWWGGIVGTIVLLISLTVAGVYISKLTTVDQDVAGGLLAVVISIAVGALIGMNVLWHSARVYAKVVFSLLSIVLMTGGFFMLVIAPVIRQMNTPELAEYQGFSVLIWFGALSTIAGIVLAGACIRWATRPIARRRLARWSRLLGSAYGVMLGISGLFGLIGLFFLINQSGGTDRNGRTFSIVAEAILVTYIAMQAFVPGVLLTYQGISASMGEKSSEYRPPLAALGVAMFGGVLLIGHLNMSSADPIAAPMPELHVLAAALPGITFAAMAARGSLLRGVRVRYLSWRQLTLAIAISMSVATTIAIYVEALGGVGAVMLMLVHNGAFEFARDGHDANTIISHSHTILSRNEQFFAGLIVASLLAPLSEEFGKSLSVRFMLRGTSTRAQAFALGAAAGAGFGFLEAMSYGLAGVSGDLGGWWQIMLLRGGSTSLHVFCTGLTGVAWWYWTVARRKRPALGLFALAVSFHALWNAAFTVIGSRILGLDTLSDRTLEIIAYTIVTIVAGIFIIAIPVVARMLRDRPPATVAGTPMESLAVWLG